ncbi:caspase family protein [Afipia sp. GAS231]|uniref:caspase family protein n=1 Tax=Afipia sp. GAS231 TaxID=1882747 RepID=UPI00352A094D
MADKRVAFVIGNSNYQNVGALTNPANDAAAITEMFKKAAFDVVESRRDLKNTEMRRALRDFTEKARDADIAVIYYAGHGIEVDGTNYLIPVDAALERDTDAYDEAIALDRILQAIEPAKQLRLVILDACRDNPFAKSMKRTVASRSLGRGLAGVEPSRPNTLIAFAAKGGSTASDGDSKNSPFTTALLRYLVKPGLELGKAFRLVRDDVMNATANKQEPFVYGSLGGNDVALVPAPAAPPPAGNANANADLRRDYELAERVGTKEAWDSFILANPSGFYTDLAKAQRNKLAAEAARIAATEKAREAAEERTRLAAEGAKAAEQAKAAAQSKAAEEARLAAEKKKQVEDAKVVAAEQAKVAAQAKAAEEAEKARLAAEKKKQTEDAKLAAAEQAKAVEQQNRAAEEARKLEGAKLEGAKVAAVEPAKETVKSDGPAQDIPRLLQSELKRVGCKTGEINGEWNASSRQALASFNDKAGTKFDVKVASIDALDAVKAKPGRVCPLECERGTRANGDSCVKITCDDGYVLGSSGSCEKRPERKPAVAQRERRAPAAAGRRGGKCFMYNGTSFCE